MWGIDISKWQGDFPLHESGAEFVIIKAGGSDGGEYYIDSQFLNNYTKAKNLGLSVGIYWYTAAVNTVNLNSEIDYLLDKIKGLQFEMPVYLDIEEQSLYRISPYLAETWLNRLTAAGYYPGIYTGYAWWRDALAYYWAELPPEQKWLALWINDSSSGENVGVWQNGQKWITGGEVDSDYCYCDFSFIKEKGLNGFMDKQYFSDVTADRKDYKAIQWAAKEGYIKGYPDGTFKPDDNITRGQLATIIWRMEGRPDAN